MLETIIREGRNNRTLLFYYYSEKDNAILEREGFPYEVKNNTLFYYDYEKKDTRRIKLPNLKKVVSTGKNNTTAPYPCKL